jgi:hypothetical protein
MNQRRTGITGELVSAPSGDTRLDIRRRDIVDCGLAVQQCSTTMVAFEYLRSRDIDLSVIERVLLGPELRRLASG